MHPALRTPTTASTVHAEPRHAPPSARSGRSLESTAARLRMAACLLPVLALVACGGNGARGVHPGTMPEGGSFHGAWLSPQYGDMHLCVTGRNVIGNYVKNEREGRIRGEIDGDILWFNWEESRTYVPGNPVEVSGRGYFRLSLNEDNDNVLTGEWGVDQDRTGGGPWTAIKRRRQGPDTCDGSSRAVTGREVSWDEEEGADSSSDDEL